MDGRALTIALFCSSKNHRYSSEYMTSRQRQTMTSGVTTTILQIKEEQGEAYTIKMSKKGFFPKVRINKSYFVAERVHKVRLVDLIFPPTGCTYLIFYPGKPL